MRLRYFSFLALAISMLSSQAIAAPYGMAGCGLGALVFKEEPGKIQILAATTNNIISPQTSAITSGTSGCDERDARYAAQSFINVNQEAIRKDASRGNGDTLKSLSKFYNCKSADVFGVELQKNYETVFPNPKASASDIDRSIISTIKNDEALNKSCASVG